VVARLERDLPGRDAHVMAVPGGVVVYRGAGPADPGPVLAPRSDGGLTVIVDSSAASRAVVAQVLRNMPASWRARPVEVRLAGRASGVPLTAPGIEAMTGALLAGTAGMVAIELPAAAVAGRPPNSGRLIGVGSDGRVAAPEQAAWYRAYPPGAAGTGLSAPMLARLAGLDEAAYAAAARGANALLHRVTSLAGAPMPEPGAVVKVAHELAFGSEQAAERLAARLAARPAPPPPPGPARPGPAPAATPARPAAGDDDL
jgi:hypothetical protein